MAGPPTSSFGTMAFNFEGINAPTGAVATIGVSEPALGFTNSTWQSELVSAATDLVQLTCNTAITLIDIDIKQGPSATGPTFNIPVNEPGAQTGDTMGPQVAMLVRKEIDGVSTRLAGRAFWPGLTVGNVTPGGVIESTALAGFQAAWTDFYEALVLLTSAPYVFNETSDPRFVESFTVQAKVATQRRRNRR